MKNTKPQGENKKNLKFVIPIVIGLIVSLPLNFLISMYLGWDPSILENHVTLMARLISQWIIVIFLFLSILFWEKRSLDSIGIKKIVKTDVVWGFVVLILQFISFFLTERLITSLDLVNQSSETAHILMLPVTLRIFMVLTAGITEEIIFRGYLIEKINLLTNHLVFSAIISCLTFTIFHIPFWGIGGAIQIAIWTIPITILYVRRRNLTTCILVHLLYDGVILVPTLMGY